jgi:imidazolonepropionase
MTVKLFRNARIYTPVDGGRPAAGADQGKVAFYERGALLTEGGRIVAVGAEEGVTARLNHRPDMEIDCGGACLIPGFVDPHTHICFAERREREFELRRAGTPYLEILRQGGGILSSVRAVRAASEEELFEVTVGNVLSALSLGTTTMEIKSGYGLDTENELKMLRVIDRIRRETPLDITATFMGAHAIPEEFKGNGDGFVDLIISEMIPAVVEQGIADTCDIFCEEGIFSVEQSRRLLEAARAAGMKLRAHVDEVHDTGGAAMAGELGVLSAEHLLAANDDGLRAMAASGVIADLLPGTAYSLRKPYARARKMIELNVPVACATDCNPGSCFCESMPFIFGLSVMNMDMTPEEALTAMTLNSAYSAGLAERVGSLDEGKSADFLLLDCDSPAGIAYHAGVSPVLAVYKRGEHVA